MGMAKATNPSENRRELVTNAAMVKEELQKVAIDVEHVEKQSGYVGQYSVRTNRDGLAFEHYNGPINFEVMSVWATDDAIVFGLRATIDN